jgi:pyroglutamyl-peptidase
MMGRKVALVTGFEPYAGRDFNPAAGVATRLDGTEIAGARVVGCILPASLSSIRQRIRQVLADVDPIVVIGLGLWPGESVVRIERLATNVMDFEIPDNDGQRPVDQGVDAAGPPALFATLPVRAIQGALIEAGIPARLSSNAGTLLCNTTLYTFLSDIERSGRSAACGFIHLPYAPQQVARLIAETHAAHTLELHQRADLASMSVETMVEAVRIALSATLALANGRP